MYILGIYSQYHSANSGSILLSANTSSKDQAVDQQRLVANKTED